MNDTYRLLSETLVVRRTFFHDLKTLTRYLLFESWEALFVFMLDGLELSIPPPYSQTRFSDLELLYQPFLKRILFQGCDTNTSI